jgi:hypothetical protein
MTKTLRMITHVIIVLCGAMVFCAPAHAADKALPTAESLENDRSCWVSDPWMDLSAREKRWDTLQKDPAFLKAFKHLKACNPKDVACLNGYLSHCFAQEDLELFNRGTLRSCLAPDQIPGISQDSQYLTFLEDGERYSVTWIYEQDGWKLHSFKLYGD